MNSVLEALLPLLIAVEVSIPTALALLTRVSTFVLILPGIGEGMVPMRVRIFVAFSFTLLLLPIVDYDVSAVTVPLMASEAIVGLALGFSVRVFFFALSLTGSIIAQALSLSQVLGFASDGDSSSLLSTALTLTATVLFFSSDLDVLALSRFANVLRDVPLGLASTLDAGGMADQATDFAKASLELGLMLAIPFAVLNFAYYLTVGFLNRAMPQLMITFVGLPAIVLSGMLLFMVCVGALLTVWLNTLSESLLS
ncbi:MAG: flagellar biosynthetic protein FliR [Parvularculaceae bacterium]|nr:flagellar biosynthetic protein FliR [Parvularculaceae bacterium]